MISIKRFIVLFIYIGLPVVGWYHQLRENVFLSIVAQEATGLEYCANVILQPVHYLIDARVAVQDDVLGYHFESKFQYRQAVTPLLCLSAVTWGGSFLMGTTIKALSYLSSDTRARHQEIKKAMYTPVVLSQNEKYAQQGMDIVHNAEFLQTQGYLRKPGEENHFSIEKEGLRQIAALLEKHHILFWVDCGTLLGTLRHGGIIPWDEDIDLAILEPDHDNVRRVLQSLDEKKYAVQDWSSRIHPKTYIRVYIKETHQHIDIYHFAIDEMQQCVSSILSNEESRYMPKKWKMHEKRFCVPTPFFVLFPLKKAFFDGIEVWVPNQTEEYLKMRYGENITPAKIYNERTQQYEKDVTHPYWQHAYGK